MNLRESLKIPLAIAVVATLLGLGAFATTTVEAMSKQASATLYLRAAGSSLKNGDKGRALFFAGSAAALDRSAFVLASAAEIAIEVGNRKLASDLLTESESTARNEDARFVRRVRERLNASDK